MRSLDLPQGPWEVQASQLPDDALLGVRSGVLLREHTIAGVTTADMLTTGDVFRARARVTTPPLPPIELSFRVVSAARVVVIDDVAATALCADPQIAARLLIRAADQGERLAAMRAVSHLPRVEQRLLAFFAELAARHGRVGVDGVVLPVRFSHAQLGRLVGAQRSTVTLAITALADDGRISRRADGRWVLAHEVVQEVVGPPARDPRRPPTAEDLAALHRRIEALRHRFEGRRRDLSDPADRDDPEDRDPRRVSADGRG